MFTVKNEQLMFIICIASAVVLVLTYSLKVQKNTPQGNHAVILPYTPVVPTPVPVPNLPEISEFPASDGKKNLTMEKLVHNTSVSYSFTVSSVGTDEKLNIFSKDETNNTRLSVPFNAWSPNDAYFFLKEEGEGRINYYVFHSNGKGFSEELAFVNVTEFFEKKLPDLLIEDVTGWAGDNLLLVNTKSKTGEPGSSYWFTVTNQSFTRLSTHFY